jgi:hypothetical protein
MKGSDRARLCPSCQTVAYRIDELSETQIIELISEDTRFTKLVPVEAADQPTAPKLYRREDGTFAANNIVCPQSEIHDPWCSWRMTKTVLGSLCALIGLVFFLGVFTAGFPFFIGCPITVFTKITEAWSASFPFCLIPTGLLAVACLNAPKRTHPCHWLSLAPVLSAVLIVVWTYWWQMPGMQYPGLLSEGWPAYVAGAVFFASVIFSLFLWSIYKGHRFFFTAVLVLELGLQLICLFK